MRLLPKLCDGCGEFIWPWQKIGSLYRRTCYDGIQPYWCTDYLCAVCMMESLL